MVKTWNILSLLKVTEEHFRKNNIESPRLNAELLLCGTLNTKRINLYLDFEKPVSEAELDEYRGKIKRRLSGEPLQYILGEAEFYGLRIKVNPSVLIPRLETELLVDKALELINSHKLENPAILEIGTGSGCISIAIASQVTCKITAIDSSSSALETAEENSAANNTSQAITFRQVDFMSGIDTFNGYDLIISNPPYIAEAEIPTLQKEVKDFEPLQALTDGEDGLSFYRKILELAGKSRNGLKLLIEVGDGKKQEVETLIKAGNIKNYRFYKDLIGTERVVLAEV